MPCASISHLNGIILSNWFQEVKWKQQRGHPWPMYLLVALISVDKNCNIEEDSYLRASWYRE